MGWAGPRKIDPWIFRVLSQPTHGLFFRSGPSQPMGFTKKSAHGWAIQLYTKFLVIIQYPFISAGNPKTSQHEENLGPSFLITLYVNGCCFNSRLI
jgi:hypothetical protein